MIKYTVPFLTKLEELIGESDHTLRYEKGNFKSGYCFTYCILTLILMSPDIEAASSNAKPSTIPDLVAFIPTPASEELVIKSPFLMVPFSELYFT